MSTDSSIVKTMTFEPYTLIHTIVEGFFGQPENSFIIERKLSDGATQIFPFYAPIKIRSVSKKDSIFALDTYTDEEYEAMFKEQIDKIEQHVIGKYRYKI